MAEKAGDTHVGEIIDSMIGDMLSGTVKSAIKGVFSGMASEAAGPWKRKTGAMFLGTPSNDEQMYWAAIKHAEEISSVEEIDQYLIAVANLPTERQNAHQENTIQTWATEFAKSGGFKELTASEAIKIVVETTGGVIASHAKRIARNPDAWDAVTEIQDIKQPIVQHDFTAANAELERKIRVLQNKKDAFYTNLNPINWFKPKRQPTRTV